MSEFVYRTYLKVDRLVEGIKAVASFPKQVMQISQVIDKPTYYPEYERKTRSQRWKENFLWLCKNKELNKFYTSYGLDIKGRHNPDDFIPNRCFRANRTAGNQKLTRTYTGSYNYIVLLRDKYAFANYLQSVLGEEYVVPTVALACGDRAYFCQDKAWKPVADLLNEDGELVFKLLDGECADGVMLVQVKGDAVTAEGTTCSKQEFVAGLGNKRFIVQHVVKQHAALQAFGTKSVNTIRMVTIQGKSGEVGIFNAFLRLSASADSFVDNRAKGGLGIGIHPDSGKLMKYGLPHDAFGVKQEVHSLSGIRFDGYQLPYWQEAVELAKNAHKQFYEIQSIGWDIILTENGPVLLEGNDDWEIGGPQDTYGGLKKRWSELVNG